jgi:hypothetical protein
MSVLNDIKNREYRRIYCCCCGKQAVWDQYPSIYDKYITKMEGSKAGFKFDEVFCGYCAMDLDENGLFPEERASKRY